MTQGTILLNSITGAIQAQKLLESHGMRGNIRKISKTGPGKGCGYALDVQGDIQQATRLLHAQGIKFRLADDS